jgi:hypothetical protein
MRNAEVRNVMTEPGKLVCETTSGMVRAVESGQCGLDGSSVRNVPGSAGDPSGGTPPAKCVVLAPSTYDQAHRIAGN